MQATCEWDIHAFIAYDAIHKDTSILSEVENMTREEVFNALKDYTLSNNGKEAMKTNTLHAYSEEV